MTDTHNRAREQGVALMMTLGILSLILILAMSFSFTARTGRMLSENNADMVRVRLQAKAALDRIIADIGFTFDPSKYGTNDKLILPDSSGTPFLHSSSAPYGNRYLWISKQQAAGDKNDDLGEALTASLGFPATNPFLPELTAGQISTLGVGWEHIKDFEDKLIARRAFIIIGESYKIDLRGSLTPNHEPYWASTPADGYFDLDNNGSYTSSGIADSAGGMVRLGLSPEEIRVLDRTGAFATWPTWANRFEVGLPVSGSGLGTDWFSWRHIALGLPLSSVSTADITYMTQCYTPYSYDIEAFRYDSGSGGEKDYHRLDLWKFPWDVTTWDKAALESLYTGGLEEFFASNGSINAVPASPCSAPALEGFLADDGTTDLTLQVLANLVDFLDADYLPTYIDNDSTSGWSDGDIYGTDKTVNINEAAFVGAYTFDDQEAAGGTVGDTTDDTGDISLDVRVELVNLYDEDLSFDTCEIKLTLEYCDTGGTYAPATLPNSGVITLSTPTTVTVSGRYVTIGSTVSVPQITTAAPAKIDLRVASCTISLADSSGNVLDFACPVKSTPLVIGTAMGAPPDGEDTRYASAEVNDPRCNTTEPDWTPHPELAATSTEITLGLLTATGARNAAFDPTVGGESETATDPEDVSTVYIANKAEVTFWELGAIHRAEPWRTINLKSFPSNASRKHSEGDATILSQIKLGGFIQTRGKVNANCPDEMVWRQVLAGLRLGCTYASPGTGGALIPDTTVKTMATALQTYNTDASKNRFLQRGEFVELTTLSNASAGTQDTDRLQEELIGKLANILTVRQNLFTALVTVQTVKDTGTTNAMKHNTIEYDTTSGKYCNILAEQRTLATVYRDALNNQFRVVHVEYLED